MKSVIEAKPSQVSQPIARKATSGKPVALRLSLNLDVDAFNLTCYSWRFKHWLVEVILSLNSRHTEWCQTFLSATLITPNLNVVWQNQCPRTLISLSLKSEIWAKYSLAFQQIICKAPSDTPVALLVRALRDGFHIRFNHVIWFYFNLNFDLFGLRLLYSAFQAWSYCVVKLSTHTWHAEWCLTFELAILITSNSNAVWQNQCLRKPV